VHPQLAAQGQAVFAGQHQVEDHQVDQALGQAAAHVAAMGRHRVRRPASSR
jgi:hypothetical protein